MSNCCRDLLSQGLDLCVRARRLDAQERTNIISEGVAGQIDLERYALRHNANHPDQPVMTRSATIPLWVQDQYEKDLAAWEDQTRRHLQQGCQP